MTQSLSEPSLIPPISIQEHDGILVVRDDLCPGGTKRRAATRCLYAGTEYVYASPAFGYAQIALGYATQDLPDLKATIFTAKRREMHPRTKEAHAAGAKIVMVPNGYMTVVGARAEAYANEQGAVLLPFGFDWPAFREALKSVAIEAGNKIGGAPREVWSVAGSGVLTSCLQAAWPSATFHAVVIGTRKAQVGGASVYFAPEKYEEDAKIPPPFPSCSNYDAKAWQFIKKHAKPGAIFWNVGK